MIKKLWHKGKTNNVRITMDYFFHKKALKILMGAKFGDGNEFLSNKKVMKNEYLSYVEKMGIYEADYKAKKKQFRGAKYSGYKGKLEVLYEIMGLRARALIGRMTRAFSADHDKLERYNNFAKLRKSPMFRQIGTGFLVNLLSKVTPPDEMEELMYMDAKFTSENKNSVEIQYGSNPERDLFEVVRFIEFVLNNDAVHADEWVKIQEMIQKTVLVHAK